MHRDVVTLRQDESLDLADDIMRLGRIRHLPVVQGEQLVGILSSHDLLAASLSRALEFEPEQRRAFLRSVEVKEVMSLDVDTASPDDSGVDAGRRMLRRKIGCLPVVDERGVFLGLLTETDLLRAAIVDSDEADADEEEVMDVKDVKGEFDEELSDLRRIRDELRVQIHLGKAEALELWENLEGRFAEVEGHAKALAKRAEEPVQDIAEAARLLIEEIGTGYKRLRDLL
ncbi:MAG: CBS domain-containing protein [Myxococcota bacterium]